MLIYDFASSLPYFLEAETLNQNFTDSIGLFKTMQGEWCDLELYKNL